MKQNLETLKTEMLEHLESQGFAIFHGFTRMTETTPAVYWDVKRQPDFRAFLAVAKQAGAKMIVFNQREFAAEELDDLVERLADAELPPDDYRELERRLHDMRAYQGFTCVVELSFDYEGRLYVYNLHTDWYLDYLDAADEIDTYLPDEEEEEEEDEGPIGGYFSRN
jgi:hypothetical protein